MSSFISFNLLKFLHQSLGVENFSSYSQYAYHKGEKFHKTMHIHLNLFGGVSSIPAPLLVKVILAFSVFDAFIDERNPELEGLSLSSKYEKLPTLNDVEKIKKAVYRIIRLIRNKIIHAQSKVDVSGVDLIINDGSNAIKISKAALNSLLELVLVFIEYDQVTDLYFDLIVKSYYMRIMRGISEFSDTSRDLLPNVFLENSYFYHKQRFLFYISDVQLDLNNVIHIKRHLSNYVVHFLDAESMNVIDSDDYLIKTLDGELFLLPGFKIPSDGLVEKSTLYQWRIGENWFGKLVVLSQIENI